MRQQIRLRVLLPLAVLGLLGAGVGAYAVGRPPEAAPLPPPATTGASEDQPEAEQPISRAEEPAPDPGKQNVERRKPSGDGIASALRAELEAHGVAVVVFFSPKNYLDAIAVREARAGAVLVDAGFLPVDTTNNKAVRNLSKALDVLRAPAVLILRKDMRVASKFLRYADRETVAQAVVNARP